MKLIEKAFRRYDARSTATLISTGGVLPLPVIAVLAPDTLHPGGLAPLLVIWSFIATAFVITAFRERLSDGEFAVLGSFGIIGICGTSLILANPRPGIAVLALVAVIPAIAAMSPSMPLVISLLALAVTGATTVLAVTSMSVPAFMIGIGSMLGVITVPVFLVVALRRSLEATLHRQARLNGIDPLTGLFNRRGFLARVAQLLAAARVSTGWVGILLMDIDHFKQINDRHGHLAGDGVLLSVAAAIRETAPSGSVVSRFGGEEFLVFCVARDEEELHALAEQFRVAVAEANPVTLSVGGVCAPLVTSTRANALATDTVVSRLLDRADRCVYRAKESGRDRVDVVSMDPIVWRKPSDKSDALDPVMRSTPPDSLYQLFSRRPEDVVDYPRTLDD
ncbi:diguanylate cyclase [Gordonia sp. ABSL11-1]|uniref:GGDEF domain-containing protein n=1 Tax=Gordonia sp. ABSL11-1 TaxID=3053924 RepID=UPI0025737B5B|nr:diguanylate cyclase [Gordonia sp. ABSL11-1]MDL9947975.1 diguanylate cyclase [Gordonia sp. ABSL11-1]